MEYLLAFLYIGGMAIIAPPVFMDSYLTIKSLVGEWFHR